jgi:hypothetical protein
MPSLEHEAIVEVLRGNPEVLAELLEGRVEVELGALPARVMEPDFTQVVPAEFRADGLIVFGEPARFGLVVEIQRRRDGGKRQSWPLYLAAAHAQLACPCWLVVIASTGAVARWAARPIKSFQPGWGFAPLVIGPEQIPRVTDRGRALASPGMAVLSALVHAHDPADASVAIAAVEGLVGLPTNRATLYFQFLQGVLSEPVFAEVEAHMEQHKIPYRIPFAKKAYEQGQADGRQEGVQALRQAVLTIVAARVGSVEPELVARIETCCELAVLKRWLEAVATADDTAAIRSALGD